MQNQELVGPEGELGVRPALVIGELDLVGAIQKLHNCPDLSAQKPLVWDIFEQRDDVEQPWSGVHPVVSYFRKQLVSRGTLSPRRTIHVLRTIPFPRGPLISNSST